MWCRFSYRLAVLVLLWDFLMYFQVSLFRYFITTSLSYYNPIWSGFDVFYCLMFLFFPLLGLLADVRIGRYRAVLIGIVLCFLAWLLMGITYIIASVLPLYDVEPILWTAYGIAFLLEVSGYASFKANIVQYNIDQVVGASADELNTIIYWHPTFVPIALTVILPIRCLVAHQDFLLASYIASGIAISLILVTHSFFKHKLENISLIENPLKLIAKVLHYARKHKYPENRSALTYWEEEAPSRLDLGKEKYGGPFTEEEVENVKTVLRMLPLIIATIGLACSNEVFRWDMIGSHSVKLSFVPCIVSNEFASYLTSVLAFIVYLFLIRLCFYKYIPSMLTRISVGLMFALADMISKVIIIKVLPPSDSADSPYVNEVLLLSQILFGLAFSFTFPASLEFTIAQAPIHMRGVMVGLWLSSLGVGYLINTIIKIPFRCGDEFICTSPYYYVTKSVIVLLILIVFVILAKNYKYRVRENEVNIHQIVDDHYQRYIEQEDEHNKDVELSMTE